MKDLDGNEASRCEHPGQVLVMFAAALFAFLGILALTVDVGFLMAERRAVQNAADAAAMATARELSRQDTVVLTESGRNVGYSYAANNGYDRGNAGTDVSIELENNGDDRFEVEAIIDEEISGFFSGFITGDLSVSSRAVATVLVEETNVCIWCEDELSFSGNGEITVVDCDIFGKTIECDGNVSVDVDGDAKATDGINCTASQLSANSIVDNASMPEECAPDWEAPSCDAGNGEPIWDPNDNERVILTPGSYTSQIQAREIYLTQGIYCFGNRVHITDNVAGDKVIQSVDMELTPSEAGELDEDEKEALFAQVDSSNSGGFRAKGGVVLYFSGNNARLQLTGDSQAFLRSAGRLPDPPSDCGEACDDDLVLWMSDNGCRDFETRGNVANEIMGVIYAPCSTVSMGGTSSHPMFDGMIIAQNMEIFGNADLTLDYTGWTCDVRNVYLTE